MADPNVKTRRIRINRVKKIAPVDVVKQSDATTSSNIDPFDTFYDKYDSVDTNFVTPSYNEFDSSEFKNVSILDEPIEGKWKLPPMYKVGARGEDRYYQIGFDGENIVTKHGQVGGEIQTSKNKVELNTSGRNISQQAMIKARNLFRKYYRQNYREKGSSVPIVKQPMCGHPLKDAKNLEFPVALEVKFDGVRGLFELSETGEVQVRSRGNKLYSQFGHICKYMSELFMYLPPGTILDGEIYKHGFDQEDISGTARTINIKADQAEKMGVFIFDAVLPDNPYYEDRKKYIETAFNKFLEDTQYNPEEIPIEIVPYKVVNSLEEIYDFHKWSRENGYEGTVIKRMAVSTSNKAMCQYKGGKSGRFYKLKDVFDEEGIILEVLNCTGKEAGCARFKVIDPRGNIFTVRPKGSYEYRQELYQKKDELIGHLFKYECSGLTKYDVPEHPRGIAVRYDLDTDEVVEQMVDTFTSKGICVCSYIGGDCKLCREKIVEDMNNMNI